MIERARGPAAIVATLIIALSLPHAARAQSGADMAARSALLDRAMHARQAGDHAAAIDFAQRAYALGRSLSLLRFLAEENVAAGRIADALGFAQTCVRNVDSEPRTENREHVVAGCRELVDSLGPRVGYVTVRIPSDAPTGTEVRLNGRTLEPALWGVESIVTPGVVHVTVAVPSRTPVEAQMNIAAGAHVSIPIALPPPEAPSPSPPPTAVATSSAPPAASMAPSAAQSRSDGRTARVVIGIAGLVLGAGLIGGALAIEASASSQYNSCIATGCSVDQQSSIHLLDGLATGGVYAGAAIAALGGIVLVVTLVSHADRSAAAFIDPARGVAGIRGVF